MTDSLKVETTAEVPPNEATAEGLRGQEISRFLDAGTFICTRKGNRRADKPHVNEDCAGTAQVGQDRLLVVADGMGGMVRVMSLLQNWCMP